MKVSILIPTYNDVDTIEETLNSVVMQTYKNWELLIMNDGSSDNTEEFIQSYINKNNMNGKIKYYKQDNADQLNAILNLVGNITGDYVHILHSDDLLYDKESLSNCVNYMANNPNIDAIYASLYKINESGKNIGILKAPKYKGMHKSKALSLLWQGSNMYVDVFFAKRDIFTNNIRETYLTWNMPFWSCIGEGIKKEMNIRKVDFYFTKYRIHQSNYINNKIGKLNVLNGELRMLINILKEYRIPFYNTQFFIARFFRKFKIGIYTPVFFIKGQKSKVEIIEQAMLKRIGKEYIKNDFLKAVYGFYKNEYSERIIEIEENILEEDIFKGKDMRKFNNLLLEGRLPNLYKKLFIEMENGFSIIKVKEEDKEKIKDICKFLCIYPYIKIISKNTI